MVLVVENGPHLFHLIVQERLKRAVRRDTTEGWGFLRFQLWSSLMLSGVWLDDSLFFLWEKPRNENRAESELPFRANLD
jgi:hypothetical protein